MALLITTHEMALLDAETAEPGQFDEDGSLSVSFMNRFVDGHVQAVFLDPPIVLPEVSPDVFEIMIVNEDGKRLELPLNQQATAIGSVSGLMPGDFIAGNAILLKQGEWN